MLRRDLSILDHVAISNLCPSQKIYIKWQEGRRPSVRIVQYTLQQEISTLNFANHYARSVRYRPVRMISRVRELRPETSRARRGRSALHYKVV